MDNQVSVIQCANFEDVLVNDLIKPGCLLVTSATFINNNMADRLIKLSEKSIVGVIGNVTANPSVTYLALLLTQLNTQDIQQIVALGGGSVIDTAKILSVALQVESLQACFSGSLPHNTQRLPVIAIPTTAGTGAEVTPFATLWDVQQQKKLSLSGVTPEYAVLDARLTLTLSRQNTLYPALDALSHAVESLWNINKTAESQKLALSAIRKICDALPKALEKPNCLSSREQLLIAANEAGAAITLTKTAIAHAISYPITMKYGVPHGLACSFTLHAILLSKPQEYKALLGNNYSILCDLLVTLDLLRELRRYVSSGDLLSEFDYNLEPSRLNNFSGQKTPSFIEHILEHSQRG